MRLARLVFILLVFNSATLARAEVIQLKNGDRLNGTFVHLLNGNVIFKTENLGTLTIPVANVTGFTSPTTAVVILKSGKTERGTFSVNQSGVWHLQSTAGTETLQPADVVAVYPLKVYLEAHPKKRHMPWQDWGGQGSLGYVLQESSQNSRSLSVNFTSARVEPNLPGLPPRRDTHFSFNMAFATVTQSGVTTKANTLSSVLRQDFFFNGNARNYFFLQGEWDHLSPQELSLRQTYGGGLGRDLIRDPKFTLGVQGGLTYVRSDFSTGVLRNEMEALAGEKITMTVFKRLKIDHAFDVYPSLTTAGDYRFNSVTSLDAPISSRLSLNVSLTDQYLNHPIPGTQANVLILSTGVGVNF